jgi:hypothetical protein
MFILEYNEGFVPLGILFSRTQQSVRGKGFYMASRYKYILIKPLKPNGKYMSHVL